MEIKIKTHTNKESLRDNYNPLYVEMGKRLRTSRIDLNYTQEQMAEILEISSAYYGKVERRIHGLSLKKLVLVNKKFGIDINYLLTGNGKAEMSFDKIMEACPKNKRYDMEQLIKYAMNLVKNVD